MTETRKATRAGLARAAAVQAAQRELAVRRAYVRLALAIVRAEPTPELARVA